MRDLAALLFGHAPDEPSDVFEPVRGRRARVRDAQEWCQSTPGYETVNWLGLVLGAQRRPAREHGPGTR